MAARAAGFATLYLPDLLVNCENDQTMDSKRIARRQLAVLTHLAAKADGRSDASLSLADVAPTLDIAGFHGGSRFVDKTDPRFDGGSDLAYDFNALCNDGLIERVHLEWEQDTGGGVISKNPGVRVTPDGFARVHDSQRSWLSKSIERQPMTFVQILVTVLISLVTFAGGVIVGRYTTQPTTTPSTIPSTDRASETAASAVQTR